MAESFGKKLREWMRAQLETRVPGLIWDEGEGLNRCVQFLHGQGMVLLRVEGQQRSLVFEPHQCLLSSRAAFEFLYEFAEAPHHTPMIGGALLASFKRLLVPLDENLFLLFTPSALNQRLVIAPLGPLDVAQYTAVLLVLPPETRTDAVRCLPTQCQMAVRMGPFSLEIYYGDTHYELPHGGELRLLPLTTMRYYRLTSDAVLSRLIVE